MFHHQDCRRASLPIHPAKTISRYVLSNTLKELDIKSKDMNLHFVNQYVAIEQY